MVLNLVMFNLKLLCLKSNCLVSLAVGSFIFIQFILFSWRKDFFGCLNFLDVRRTCHIFHRRIPASLLRAYWRECVFIWQVSSHLKCDIFQTCFSAMERCVYQSLKVNAFLDDLVRILHVKLRIHCFHYTLDNEHCGNNFILFKSITVWLKFEYGKKSPLSIC